MGTLYNVVRDNLQTLYAAVQEGFASPLPAFVRDDFELCWDYGLLCRGFALLKCETCHAQRLLAFSCKGVTSRTQTAKPPCFFYRRIHRPWFSRVTASPSVRLSSPPIGPVPNDEAPLVSPCAR